MKRVMIVGLPGSGKSWLARRMGVRTGLPVHHMDRVHWLPGWVARERDAKIALAHDIESSDRWILEGYFSATFSHRLSRADTLVILDMPFPLRVWRVFRRTLTGYGKTRAELPENCPERFDAEFWSYIWRTRNLARRRILDLPAAAGSGVDVHVLCSRRAVMNFLNHLDLPEESGHDAHHGTPAH